MAIALEYFLKPDQTGKIGFQRKTEKTDKLIAEHMNLLEQQLQAGNLKSGGVYKIYMRVTEVQERAPTVLDSLESVDGSIVELSDVTSDEIPF